VPRAGLQGRAGATQPPSLPFSSFFYYTPRTPFLSMTKPVLTPAFRGYMVELLCHAQGSRVEQVRADQTPLLLVFPHTGF
jgi:hypothetical protein